MTKIALILEYCSRGDLRSYLIKNRHDLENSLNGVYLHKMGDTKSSKSDSFIHDVNVLYRWTYQVRHYSYREFRKPEFLWRCLLHRVLFLDCRWNGLSNK